jgi:mono/diheme cytochrome c family protein
LKSHHEDARASKGAFLLVCVPWVFVVAFVSFGCRQDMHDQPRYKPLAKSAFFGDERSARPLVEDTVARGHLEDDSLLFTGKAGADFADAFPFEVDEAILRRGQDRYRIYCTPCHGQVGRGDGAVVRRGFKNRPASFHIDRLRQKPAGYFFDVITNGFGAMQDYSMQLTANDRWAVVAYVRALQLSQNATLAEVPEAERAKLGRGGAR